ncbi:Tripartite motif containing 37 [Entophlyctis sp. JEL0112]|nr:Tripartite motif containing 37 [Entophlyctis sp. JEL0112]
MAAHIRLSPNSSGLVGSQSDPLCEEHNVPLFYFCLECNDALCSDCAVLDSKHKAHPLQHLSSVYKSHHDLIWSKIKALFQVLKSHSETKERVRNQILAIQSLAEKQHQKHEAVLRAANESVDLQAGAKVSILENFARNIDEELARIRDTVHDLQTHLKVSSRVEVVKKSKTVLEIVEKEHKCLNADCREERYRELSTIPVVNDTFQSSLIPPYDSSALVIPAFSEKLAIIKSEVDGKAIFSESLLFSGISWRLKVYCGGNKGTNLSVFLQLVEGYPSPSKYQYKIELIQQIDVQQPSAPASIIPSQLSQLQEVGPKSSREFVSEFSNGECWGYAKFYPIDDLASKGFLSSENGSLEIRFYVRAMDYAQKCRDLQWKLEQSLNCPKRVDINIPATTESKESCVDSAALAAECADSGIDNAADCNPGSTIGLNDEDSNHFLRQALCRPLLIIHEPEDLALRKSRHEH